MFEKLAEGVTEVEQADDFDVDPKALRSFIDRLEGKFSLVVRRVTERGDHLVDGHCSAVSWVMDACKMSQSSASDRLCVGKHLGTTPLAAQALSRGQIGYQSASVICHLIDKLGPQSDQLDEEGLVHYAAEHSVKELSWASAHARYILDPDGCERDTEENYEERFLHISEMKGMYHLTAVMDPEGGAALKSAIEALAKRLGRRRPDVQAAPSRRADRAHLPRPGSGNAAAAEPRPPAHQRQHHAGRPEG